MGVFRLLQMGRIIAIYTARFARDSMNRIHEHLDHTPLNYKHGSRPFNCPRW